MTTLTELAVRSMSWRSTGSAKLPKLLLFSLGERPRAIDVLPSFNKHVFRFASRADLDRIRDEHSAPAGAVDPQYHQQGDRCLLQSSGDELVGLTWVATSSLVYLSHGAYYNLPDDTCYTYNPHTSVAYDDIICRALRDQAMLRCLSGEGKRRLLTAIDEVELPDIEQIRPYGYELVGHMRMRARGGRLRLTMDVREDFWCFERKT